MVSRGAKIFGAIVILVILSTIIFFLIYERIVRKPVTSAPFPPAETVMPPSGTRNITMAPSAKPANS